MCSSLHMVGSGGGCKETDVICTIDSGIAMWHTLILEDLVETNEIIEREREKVVEESATLNMEQVNTNPTKSTPQTEMLERLMQQSANTQCLSKTVRSGGRGSLDRHTWDLINEEDLRT